MEISLIRNRRITYRLLFSLLIAMLFAAGWISTGSAEETSQFQSISIIRNTKIAVDPIRKTEGFSAILYDNQNGLPTSEANTIAQTSDGFIWIGSYAGLIRYDGNTFERIETDKGILNTRCLFVDSRDRLWIGTNDSGVFLMSNGIIRKVDQADYPIPISVRAIEEAPDGVIYVASATGIFTIDAGMNFSAVEDKRVSAETILDIRLGTDGLIYGLSQSGDLFTLKDGEVVTFLNHEECRVKGILAILPDNRKPGNLYLGTSESRIYNGNLERNFASMRVIDIAPLAALDRFEYISGDLWICAMNGIGKVDAEGFHRLKNVPMDKLVGHVMTDHEGNLWFTSTRQCVMKIVPNRFLDLFERNGLAKDVVNSTCVYGRQLFIGTESGLIVTENGEELDSLPLTKAETVSGVNLDTTDLLAYLNGVRIRSIIRDSGGRLWISTWTKKGLLRYDKGELTAFTKEDGLISDQVRTICECEDGSILAAQPDGASVIRDDRVTVRYGAEDGLAVTSILTVAEGFNHELILGSDGSGIYVIGQDGMKHIGMEEGLQSEIILRIKRSRYRDIYWIATGNSLAYMTPDYKVTTIRHFPYPNNYDLYENSQGEIWVLCSNGVYVVKAEEMLANEQIEATFYGSASGLPYVATSNSFSELTDEGDLFIAGINGTIKVNIEKPFKSNSEFKIALPYIDADGRRYYPRKSGSFTLPGNAQRLTFYPRVFSYSLADPQVSYWLDGFDLTEATVSRSKLAAVDYTNLKIGSYQFIMTVEDPVNHNDQTISFQIVKGREMSAGTMGTSIMILASLILMGGILVYTSPHRKHNRKEDRLLFRLILTNIVLAVGSLLSYMLEYITGPLVRGFMIAGNTAYYILLVFFPYLLLMYLDYCTTSPDNTRMRGKSLLYGIPCIAFIAVMLINLYTGWIFTVSEGNTFHTGRYHDAGFALALAYLLFSLIKMLKVRKRLAVLSVVLIAARLVGEICFPDISATSFFYAMILVCIHLYLTDQPLYEEAV